jgi:hypothetical protein
MWNQQENTYRANLLVYIAVLTEQPGHKFLAHIEDNENNIIRNWHGYPFEFEEAERWAIFSAVDLEQLENEETARQGMLQTLELCQPLLHNSTHPSHLQRFENIREWVISKTTHELEMFQAKNPAEKNSLNWVEQSPTSYQVPTPHGKAVIIEEKAAKSPFLINPSSSYKARIEHASGAAYEAMQPFMDFVDAEDWVRRIIFELDDPRIAEYYRGNIQFTLNICKHGLPTDVHPIHLQRLEYLGMRIYEVLM